MGKGFNGFGSAEQKACINPSSIRETFFGRGIHHQKLILSYKKKPSEKKTGKPRGGREIKTFYDGIFFRGGDDDFTYWCKGYVQTPENSVLAVPP